MGSDTIMAMTKRSLPKARCVAGAAAALFMGLQALAAWAGDAETLTDGVARIAAPGVPGPLCVFGEKAFVVATGGGEGKVRQPVVAAARLGQGRVLAFGHTGYLDAQTLAVADTGRLMTSAVRWAAGVAPAGAAKPAVAVYGHAGLAEFLRAQGFQVEALDKAGVVGRLEAFKVLCLCPANLSDAEAEAISKFIRQGGGLVAADLGWGWLQLHPGKSLLTDHPGNRLLASAGIMWADGTLNRTDKDGFAVTPPPALAHASRALDILMAQAAGRESPKPEDLVQASAVVTLAARSLPPDDGLLLPRLRQVRKERSVQSMPTAEKPLRSDRPLDRLALTLDLEEARRSAPEATRAHPAATAFPGAVPADAARVERTIDVDTRFGGWVSTGLYAAPGQVVTVAVPESAAGKGLALRIGAHSDTVWDHASWHRSPEVCRVWPLAAPVTRAACAFGGLTYLEVPSGTKLGVLSVRMGGAVEAPYFVLGKTAAAEWRERIRLRPAPWAELAADKVILTLPSKVVRGLEGAEDLMRFWDRVVEACDELSARPRENRRPERYVADVQISAGYMHSGYPIMVLMDMPEVMVDKARLMANGHGGVWGLFHELGHNYQSGDWTFGGTGEVTENLFTLYVFDKVCGFPRAKAHGEMAPDVRARKMKAYLAPGADFEKWKRDPFLALQMYIQLQEAFGWDAYEKVFAEYRALARSERPKSDADKRDQWMVRFSRAVGRNLGPFFQAWGVPTSPEARASIAGLPGWMPEGFPPVKP